MTLNHGNIAEAIQIVVEWCGAGWGINVSGMKLLIYQLEDQRFAVSRFDEAGKQLSEDLYDTSKEAAQRFLELSTRY